jgi:hypothetical protein
LLPFANIIHARALSQERLVSKLTEIGVLTVLGDCIRFRFKYYYCYFVARYIAVHIHEEATLTAQVGRLCTSLHFRDSAHIMMFLCHMARDPAIIATLLQTADAHFAGEDEYDLQSAPSIFPNSSKVQALLALEHNRPEENREQMLKTADEYNRPDALDEREDAIERAEAEVPAVVAQLTAIQYSLQLCGHLLLNYYGYLKGEEKVRLLRVA